MELKDWKKKKLSDNPGVYFFKRGREILYIGKATSIRDRTRSYFSNDLIKTRGPAIIDMVTKSTSLTFTETDSVLEALMLETALIKKHLPKYNIKEKDDRSYNSVIITDEDFPKVFSIRSRELEKKKDLKIKKEFGPFPNATQLRDALKIIRKLFPFYDDKKVSRMNIQIGLSPDPEKTTKREYQKTIRNISLFFEGKKSKIISLLEKEMKAAAMKMEFEKANEIKKTIFALNHINDVSMISDDKVSANPIRIESYDIAHMAGQNTVGVMVVMEDGDLNKNAYRKFIIRSAKGGDDVGSLKEVLTRRLNHDEWPLPKLFVIDGGKAQKNVVNRVLKEFGYEIPVVSVVKDERHKPKDILGDKKYIDKYAREILLINQETHRFAISFHRKRARHMLK